MVDKIESIIFYFYVLSWCLYFTSLRIFSVFGELAYGFKIQNTNIFTLERTLLLIVSLTSLYSGYIMVN